MKPILLGLLLGVVAFTAWMIGHSPGVMRGIIDPHYIPKYVTPKPRP